MAIAFRSSSTISYATHIGSTTVTAPAGIVNGDLLVYVWVGYLHLSNNPDGLQAQPPPGFSPFPGNWPYLPKHDTLQYLSMHLWWKVASAESGSYTAVHLGANSVAAVLCYSGAHPVVPISVVPSQNQNVVSPQYEDTTAFSITTAYDGSMVVAVGSDFGDTGNNITPPTGTTPTFTERIDQTLLYVADGILATAGATGNKTWANNSAIGSAWGGLMFSINPSTAVIATPVGPSLRALSSVAYSSKTNTTLTKPTGTVSGDLLLLYWGAYGAPEAVDPTAVPSGFTLLPGTWPLSAQNDPAVTVDELEVRIWYKIAGSSEPTSYTISHPTAISVGVLLTYKDTHPTAPITVTPSQNQNVPPFTVNPTTALSVTTTTDNSKIVLFAWDWSPSSGSMDVTYVGGGLPSFTEQLDITECYVADGTLGLAGATGNKTFNNNNSSPGPWAATMVVLQPKPLSVGGRPNVYLAGSFQKKPAKVYMGAGPGWVEKPVKVWTGSAWKTLT